MTKRKKRTVVVIDTNVFVSSFLSRRPNAPNRRVIRLWRIEKVLQLALATEIANEYLAIFGRVLGFNDDLLSKWRERFHDPRFVSIFNVGIGPPISRDRKDDVFISVANAARAKYLITNDRDLLDISAVDKRKFKFRILTPVQFLKEWEGRS